MNLQAGRMVVYAGARRAGAVEERWRRCRTRSVDRWRERRLTVAGGRAPRGVLWRQPCVARRVAQRVERGVVTVLGNNGAARARSCGRCPACSRSRVGASTPARSVAAARAARNAGRCRVSSRAGLALVAFAALLVVPYFAEAFWLQTGLFAMAAAIAAIGLTLLVGTTGQLSL